MKGKQIVTSLDLILQWIMRLAFVNVLWILFSLMGFVIGGVFPATVAALGVSRKWIMGQHDIKIWRTFKQIYRQEFIGANKLGWLLSVIGGLLYLNYRVIINSAEDIFFIIPFAFYLLLFFYIIVVIWSFPLLTHYQASIVQHIKNAIIIGLTKIHYTIVSGFVIVLTMYLSLSYPGIIPFFSFSIVSLLCMWFSMQIFSKVDNTSAG
ncbi:YesL family protein [Aquibacillus saliphilus]|uniref:YesL family protein n=1 Tax=Aquibacillus saliphilus TaxID=1909422 RepID=UPI001CF0026F|nr:YesL family protein [Aquibacillus saliphilus]